MHDRLCSKDLELFEALVIAPPIVQCSNSTCVEDAVLSRLLSDLASADPVFRESLRATARTPHRRIDVLAAYDPQNMEVQGMLEAAAELLQVLVFPKVAAGCEWPLRWLKGFQELRGFRDSHGHVRVPIKHVTTGGFNLGFWINTQRKAKLRGRLSEEQVKQLEELGFVWNVYDQQWQQMLRRLATYRSDHGHVHVPQGYVTDDGIKLGLWVNNQRNAKHRGKLSEEQVKQLEELGFVWNVYDEQWQQMLRRLATYRSDHGHVHVPRYYVTDDGIKFGLWVNNQRTAKLRVRHSEEQVKQLEELGFVWNVYDEQWQQMLRRLATYRSDHGHVHVPRDYVTDDGIKLGLWVNNQRNAKRRGKLSEEQVKQLEELGFVWNVYDEQWQQMLRRLATYKSDYGHVHVPQDYVTDDGIKLGLWVTNQRTAKLRVRHSEEQVKQLEELGFVWNVYDEQWQQMLRRLATYKSDHGHVHVPQGYVTDDGIKLGLWVKNQRAAKLRGKLSEEQVKQLEEPGFVWNVYDEQRKQMLRRLVTYKSVHGHVHVPRDYVTDDGSKLGHWVNDQRMAKHRGKLSEEQVKQLEELGLFGGNEKRSQRHVYRCIGV